MCSICDLFRLNLVICVAASFLYNKGLGDLVTTCMLGSESAEYLLVGYGRYICLQPCAAAFYLSIVNHKGKLLSRVKTAWRANLQPAH